MRITIITPSLNRAEFIEEAIQSVLHQDYPHFEHIIMDGGSTDGTLEVCASYPHLRVISEPDEGMYAAMNKGIQFADGDYIGFLNSDDMYASRIFEEIVHTFDQNKMTRAVVGEAVLETFERKKTVLLNYYPSVSQENIVARMTRGHPIFNAWFFRKDVFSSIGLFNTQYKFAADREFIIRLYLCQLNFLPINMVFYHYRQHPNSLTYTGLDNSEHPFMYENLKLTEFYLNSDLIENANKKSFIDWHSDITSDQAFLAIRRGALGSALQSMIYGSQYNPGWIIHFCGRELPRIFKYFRKQYISRR